MAEYWASNKDAASFGQIQAMEHSLLPTTLVQHYFEQDPMLAANNFIAPEDDNNDNFHDKLEEFQIFNTRIAHCAEQHNDGTLDINCTP